MADDITNSKLLEKITSRIDEKFERLIQKIDENQKTLNEKIEAADFTIKKLTNENTELKERITVLEQRARRNNIAVFGLKINENNLLLEAIKELNSLLKINIVENDISNIYWPKNKDLKTPVIIEFISTFKKRLVFSNIKNNLLALKNKRIFITNDMSKEERQVTKYMKEKYKEAKEKKLNAQIKGKKLIIEGQEYDYTTLKAQAEHLEKGRTEESDTEDITNTGFEGQKQASTSSSNTSGDTQYTNRPRRNQITKKQNK